MNDRIHPALLGDRLIVDVLPRLDADFGFREEDGVLKYGVCPTCSRKSLSTDAAAPWLIQCQRRKCGSEWHASELLPDLFERWSDRFPATDAQPAATADAWLTLRCGFDLERLRGHYSQEHFFDPKQQIGSATVRIAVGDGHLDRLLDAPKRFGSPERFKGAKLAGSWWVPPGVDPAAARELWIVGTAWEALALMHHDVAAVATLADGNDCQASLDALAEACAAARRGRPQLVWALTGEDAERVIRRRVRACREAGWEAGGAQLPRPRRSRVDFVDLHLRGKLEAAHLADYRQRGALLCADKASEKGVLIYSAGKHGSSFAFEFGSRLFWFKLDMDKYQEVFAALEEAGTMSADDIRNQALLESHSLTEICNCHPEVLYFQRHEQTDESWYYVRVTFPGDKPAVKGAMSPAAIASATELKKRLLSIGNGAYFTGTTGQADAYFKRQTESIPAVQVIDFIGYVRAEEAQRGTASGLYVFGDIAVKNGRVIELNDEDYFEVGRTSIKSVNSSVALRINTREHDFKLSWVRALWHAFGAKGVVALAFWFGSLFAEQIRSIDKSFPFIEIVGEPGAGKSTLIEFLWKLCGRPDYEGFDPSKSTLAARSRNFSQVSNLPVVLIESDRGDDGAKKGSFDFDELKTAFNGRAARSRGVKNGGNETYEPPFRGSIVISQNAPVNASEAILSRIVHLFFDRAGQTTETRVAAKELERAPVEDVSGFVLRAALAESAVLATYQELTPAFEATLAGRDGVKTQRVIKNHAQVMALVSALGQVFPAINEQMVDAAHDDLMKMAREREDALSADHPYVAEFWELYEFLEGDGEDDGVSVLNHSRDRGLIAISLPHFEQVCADRKLRHAPLSELKRVLGTSRRHKFIDTRTVNSLINQRFNDRMSLAQSEQRRPTSVKCWVFTA